MADYTGGPWSWSHGGFGTDMDEIHVHGYDGRGVATTFGHVGQDEEADARLIAAAPDLLEAAKAAEELLGACVGGFGMNEYFILREALEKAERKNDG